MTPYERARLLDRTQADRRAFIRAEAARLQRIDHERASVSVPPPSYERPRARV